MQGLQARLLRLALQEVGAYVVSPDGDWLAALAQLKLSRRDQWALVFAARLLAGWSRKKRVRVETG